jgi:hypothetical protein
LDNLRAKVRNVRAVLKKGAHVAAQVVEGTVYGAAVHENTPEASKKSDCRYNNHICSTDNPWVRNEGGRDLATLALELGWAESE